MIGGRGRRKTEKAVWNTRRVVEVGKDCEKTASVFEFNIGTTRRGLAFSGG
jgi:hypothetical protein